MTKWKSFCQWTTDEVEETFGLIPQLEHSLLTDWLTNLPSLVEDDKARLATLQKQLIAYIHYWNEQELQIKFIGRLLNRVEFDQPRYKAFYEREIKTVYNNKELGGLVDFVVAEGRGSPKAPYFFIQEHKRELDSPNDPRGQLLIAMITAQILNNNTRPVYGAYIMGRAWYFVVLQDKEYAVSLAYDATKEEIFGIYQILQHTKQIIDRLVGR
ncbi:hypothetical protein QUF58_04335 [Anaerolineales bacterium HSG24]|nr:hypothetical protein [Anaerolineales bacterium HSG24]